MPLDLTGGDFHSWTPWIGPFRNFLDPFLRTLYTGKSWVRPVAHAAKFPATTKWVKLTHKTGHIYCQKQLQRVS